ncbi:MAG: S8 family serine peptidase [Rudaea sp.]
MNVLPGRWVLALLLGLAAIGGNAAGVASPADDAISAAVAHRVLVMLHLPPQHFRPGANYGGYADPPGHGARRRIAEKLARENGLALQSDWPMPALGVDCYVMRVPRQRDIADVVQHLSRDPHVTWAQPMNLFHGMGRPTSFYALEPGARLWHLRDLHQSSTGRDVRIAIVDSGVDVAHPQLSGRVSVERNFVDARAHVAEAHGTAIAGIIGARTDQGVGIVGIAPQAALMALRACWETPAAKTVCSSFTLAKALQFAIQSKAQVINLSLGGPRDELLARLLDVALARNVTVVSAADPDVPDGGFPASYPGVLAVSDTPRPNMAKPVLLAPGKDIPAAAPGGGWTFVTGTSFAAAQIAGLVALVRQWVPSASMRNPQAWAVFSATANAGPAGTVDACGTLRQIAPAFTCAPATGRTLRASW